MIGLAVLGAGRMAKVHPEALSAAGPRLVTGFGSTGMVLSDNPQATGFKRFSSTSFRALDRFCAFFIERYSESYRLEIEAFPNGLALGQSASANATDSLRAVYLAGAAEHLSA